MADLPSGTVTFLLTDVEGSTALWEQSPEEMHAALSRHDELFEAIVVQHHGIHVRPRGEGDSRFAVFTRSLDALNAAVAVQRAFAREPWATPTPILIRIGIHTGEARQRDGDYYGSAVNRCGRIRGLGRGGQILMSEATAALARDALPHGISLIDVGEHSLKGLARPERIFELAATDLTNDFSGLVASPPAPESSVASAPSPRAFPCSFPFPSPSEFIDRDLELAGLLDLLNDARTGGRMVVLGAPAGTGKSSLVGAVVRRAEQAGFLCLAGGCYESGSAAVLSPFQDALADYLLAQSPSTLRQDLGRGAADLAYVVPELRYHLDMPEAAAVGQTDRLGLFGAVLVNYFRRLAEAGPILLCIEDLHNADGATLELFRYLAHRTRGVPILLIGTYRAEEAVPGSPLARFLSELRRATTDPRRRSPARPLTARQMVLSPLARADTARLVASLLGAPARRDLDAWLFDISEGNPLFVEHLLLELRDGGHLQLRGQEWDRTSGAPHQVPGVIGDLIERRLGRVSERCRDTLAMAAVLGSTVQHRELAEALAPLSRADLLADLEEAFEAQLLQETPSGYAFTHALLRETVYWRLNDIRRRRLHTVAGETIERLAGDRVSEVAVELARHFTIGSRLLDVHTKAIRYNLEAGRRAAALASHREAHEHFDRACELLERDGASDRDSWLAALEGRCNAEWALWLWRPLIADSEQILQLTADPIRRARARNAIGYAQQQTGDTTAAAAAYDAALAELDAATDPADPLVPRLRLQAERGYLWFLHGRFHDMLRQGEGLVRTATESRLPLMVFLAQNSVALAQMGLGQFDRALHHAALASAAAEETGDSMRIAVALANFGIIHCFAGEPAAARPLLERAIALYYEAAAHRRAANTVQWLGRVWLALGDPERALELAEIASAHASEADDRWAADCHDLVGLIHLLRAEWEAAESRFEQALTARSTVGHAASNVGSLVGLGLVHQRLGNLDRARQHYERGVAVAASIDPSPFEAFARRHLGQLLLLQGDASGVDQLERAVSLVESMPRSAEYAPTLLALADLNWRSEDIATRMGRAERALAMHPAAEVAVEARLVLTKLHLAAGSHAAAMNHASEALALAERLRAPLQLGLAHFAQGQVASTEGARALAAASFALAERSLEAARTPFEQALLRQYYEPLPPA